jgi:hypothetical protein
MAADMTIKEKYIYRISSKVRTTKTHRKELLDIYSMQEEDAQRFHSGFLGFLDENLNFKRH